MLPISIIMPLYNAEKYLNESLDSVLCQTIKNFELICIDDGSSDQTALILNEYKKKDKRIKVLSNRERLGAGEARNIGIRQAVGKYIIFLDGDDIFETDMLEQAYLSMEKNNLDIIIFNYMHVNSNIIHQKKKIIHGEEYSSLYCRAPFSPSEKNPCEMLLWSTSPCNKMFLKEFILCNGIRFQTLPCANDVYFVNMSLVLAKKIMVLDDERVMLYARDHNEKSRVSFKRDPMNTYLAYQLWAEKLIEKNLMEKLYLHFAYKAIYSLKYVLEKINDDEEGKNFYVFLKNNLVYKLKEIYSKYSSKKNYFIEMIISSFQEKTYESKWYNKINLLDLFLWENRNEIIKLWDKTDNGKIILWGAGQNAKKLVKFCERNNLKVNGIIDIDENKHGDEINGIKIFSPLKLKRETGLIIVTTDNAIKAVNEYIIKTGYQIEVVDINSYLAIR
ncbi:MAG: glycosyltransferase [Lachnospiraceae bacterium]|nr:glycosyltransferase [Lachnospiraceae bacterium]